MCKVTSMGHTDLHIDEIGCDRAFGVMSSPSTSMEFVVGKDLRRAQPNGREKKAKWEDDLENMDVEVPSLSDWRGEESEEGVP
jgi:hypothetical protein